MVQVFDEWFGGSWLCLRWLCLVKSRDSKLLDVDIFISANKNVKCQQKKFQKFAMNWGKSGFPLFLYNNPFHGHNFMWIDSCLGDHFFVQSFTKIQKKWKNERFCCNVSILKKKSSNFEYFVYFFTTFELWFQFGSIFKTNVLLFIHVLKNVIIWCWIFLKMLTNYTTS